MSLAPSATMARSGFGAQPVQGPGQPRPPLGGGVARHSGVGDEGANAVAAERRLELRREALAGRQAVAGGEAVAEGEDVDVLRRRRRRRRRPISKQRMDKPAKRPIWDP